MTKPKSESKNRMPDCDVDVVIEDHCWHRIEFDVKQHVEKVALETIRFSGRCFIPRSIGLCVLLAGDERLRKLNLTYRNKDKATNVLSFPYIEPHHIGNDEQCGQNCSTTHLSNQNDATICEMEHCYLGDIAISYQRIIHESIENDIGIAEYIAHIVVHGVLHLLNYDHQTDDDTKVMEERELYVLERLRHLGIC